VRLIVSEAMGYGAASAAALLVDMTILWAMVYFFRWDYLPAACASFLAGASVAYLMSVRLAFKQHRLRDKRAEFVSFVAIGIVGLAINAGAMSVGVRYWGLNYLLAKCLASGLTFMCNFIARRQLLFVRPSSV
jgi:putative flippase GtrA